MYILRITSRIGLSLIAFALLSTLATLSFAQTLPTGCNALVQVRNNLWLVRANGPAQVTNDRQFRTAAALNQNGKIIAYSGKDSPNDVTLIDATGRLITDVNLQISDAILGLTWVTPTLLRAQEHLAPNGSRFHFMRLDPSNNVSLVPIDAEGSICSVSPDEKDIACTVSNSVVTLNGRDIYRTTDAFASATALQTIDAAVGTSVATSTSPVFRIEVKGISGSNRVQLRITTPDGLWKEQHVPPGGEMDMQFDDGSSHSVSLYGVMPVVTKNPGVVRLYVKRSDTGGYSFEGDIAWDPRGKRMAVVESNRLGQLTWVLLNREMGQAANKGNGALDAKEPLPIDGPIRSIAFASNTRIRIEGAMQVFEKAVPEQGKVPPGTPYSVSEARPRRLTIDIDGKPMAAEVKGWSCIE